MQILGVVLGALGPQVCSRASVCHSTVALVSLKLGEAALPSVAVCMLTAARRGRQWQEGLRLPSPGVRPGLSQLTREPELQGRGLQTAAQRG